MDLETRLEGHGLLSLYNDARRYLPALPPPAGVTVEEWQGPQRDTVLAYARPGPRPAVAFRELSEATLLHEALHLAGADEVEASNLMPALAYCIRAGAPPGDLLAAWRRFCTTPSLLQELLKSIGIGPEEGLEGLYQRWGILPWHLLRQENVSHEEAAATLLSEMAGGLPYGDPMAVRIWEAFWSLSRSP